MKQALRKHFLFSFSLSLSLSLFVIIESKHYKSLQLMAS